MKECSGFATLLKPEFGYYLCIWCGVLASIAFLSKILIGKAVTPTVQAMQSQKDFIAAVSHECKAPLAAILSSAEMIAAIPEKTIPMLLIWKYPGCHGSSGICSCSHPLMPETGLFTWKKSTLILY